MKGRILSFPKRTIPFTECQSFLSGVLFICLYWPYSKAWDYNLTYQMAECDFLCLSSFIHTFTPINHIIFLDYSISFSILIFWKRTTKTPKSTIVIHNCPCARRWASFSVILYARSNLLEIVEEKPQIRTGLIFFLVERMIHRHNRVEHQFSAFIRL